MTTLQFADTHNMVAFLSKPTKSDGFQQIMEFLNAHSIRWAVYKKLGDILVRAATTASSLEAEQDSGGLRYQETIKDTIAQTKFERVSKHSNDSPLVSGNTLQSDKNRLKLDELMALCSNLQTRVLDLEKTKITQHNNIASLKRRVKKLEKRNTSRTHGLKRLYKERRIDVIDRDEGIILVSVHDNDDRQMFDVDTLDGEEVFVAGQNENVVEEVVDAAQVSTAATTVTITTKEITLAQAVEALKTSKPKVKGIVFQEPGKSTTTTTTTTISSQQSRDKGKGIMIEEPVKPKKKDQIRLNEEAAKKLQVVFDEEERLAREKAKKEQEANIALIEEWDDIKANIDLVEGNENRAGEELVQKITKKQKVEDDKETIELKKLMETILNEEEVATNAIHLAVKSLGIVDWKIHKEEKKIYYQIVRADGKSQMYMIFSQMLKSFDREDLYKSVKARYGSTRPVESMDYLL
nr:hypothetical protein [Tanacetum cinerariifolium]